MFEGDLAPAKKLSMSASRDFLLLVPNELTERLPSRNGRRMRRVLIRISAFARPNDDLITLSRVEEHSPPTEKRLSAVGKHHGRERHSEPGSFSEAHNDHRKQKNVVCCTA